MLLSFIQIGQITLGTRICRWVKSLKHKFGAWVLLFLLFCWALRSCCSKKIKTSFIKMYLFVLLGSFICLLSMFLDLLSQYVILQPHAPSGYTKCYHLAFITVLSVSSNNSHLWKYDDQHHAGKDLFVSETAVI